MWIIRTNALTECLWILKPGAIIWETQYSAILFERNSTCALNMHNALLSQGWHSELIEISQETQGEYLSDS